MCRTVTINEMTEIRTETGNNSDGVDDVGDGNDNDHVDTRGVDDNKLKRTEMTKSAVPNVTKLSQQAHTATITMLTTTSTKVHAWLMSTVLPRLSRRGKTLLIPVGIP